MLSKRDEMRLQRAIRESPQNKRREELRQRIENLRNVAEQEKQKLIDAFNAWADADLRLRMLEDLRDANAPASPDDEWSPEFCKALNEIPEARAIARDLWLDYSTMKGGDNQ